MAMKILTGSEPKKKELDRIMAKYDIDRDGIINIWELETIMLSKLASPTCFHRFFCLFGYSCALKLNLQ